MIKIMLTIFGLLTGIGISKALKSHLRLCGVIALCVLMLTACTAAGDEKNADELQAAETLEPYFTEETVDSENIADFVTIGRYIGIKYNAVVADDVTDEDVDAWISIHLSHGAETVEITDRAAISGDTVTIDFEGFRDGTPFDGGTAENVDLDIGSGQFIPGFEEQIIGRRAGEEFDINVSFPDDYHVAELAGQPAVFNINLKAIHAKVAPELTDEFVKEQLNVATVAEYKAMVREQLKAEKELAAQNAVKSQVWNEIVNNSTVLKYPQDEVDFRITDGMKEFLRYAAMYNIELKDLVPQITGMQLEDFIENEVRPDAIKSVGQDLVLRAIAAAEGISISDEELDAEIEMIVASSDYESVEAFWENNDKRAVKLSLLSDKVIDVILSRAIERKQ